MAGQGATLATLDGRAGGYTRYTQWHTPASPVCLLQVQHGITQHVVDIVARQRGQDEELLPLLDDGRSYGKSK